MVRVTKETTQIYKSEYLPENEWEMFQEQLVSAKLMFEEIAKQYKMKLFQDSRWPGTGIERRSWFKHKYIRLTLNPRYLDDKRVFYELREHSIISFSIFFNKLVSNRIISIYSVDQIKDINLLHQSVETLLQR